MDDADDDDSLDDIEAHMKELEELQKADPEFYEYIRKEEGDLLKFGEDVRDPLYQGDARLGANVLILFMLDVVGTRREASIKRIGERGGPEDHFDPSPTPNLGQTRH